MRAGEFHPALDLVDGIVNEANRALAMAAFVCLGRRELASRGLEIVERGLHVRLSAARRASDQISEDEQEDEHTGEKNRSPIHPDLLLPLMSPPILNQSHAVPFILAITFATSM
jgi:hypothetical protein